MCQHLELLQSQKESLGNVVIGKETGERRKINHTVYTTEKAVCLILGNIDFD